MNNQKIDEVIATDLENLKNLEPGSVEKSKEIQNIDILYRLNLEQAKLEQAEAENLARSVREEAKAKEEAKQTLIKSGTDILKTVIPLAVYGVCYTKGLQFEETGAFTSQTVKGLLTKVKFFN